MIGVVQWPLPMLHTIAKKFGGWRFSRWSSLGMGMRRRCRSRPQGGLWHLAFHMAPDVAEMLVTGRERQYLSIFYRGLRSSGDDPNAITPDEIDEYVRQYSIPGA